ncbi:MAG: hypothetical protein LBP71_05925, partial [Spirochaetaceae bacterium]|nr:hypothetical protein [Spirochaetaceae bacterium]
MKTQIVFDPLTQPLEVYVDLLEGIHEDFKNWLKELGAGKSLMEWQFDALRSLLEDLSRVAGRVEEQKALFLFSDWKAGVHTPSNLWFELASVKFTTTEKVVKPIFGPGYGPK